MAQLKYLDLEGLGTFWGKAKTYIDAVDGDLQRQIDNITGGTGGSIPIASNDKVGGIKSGGDITVDSSGNVTVNNASALKNSRNITLQGGATGSASFNGSADAVINVTVDPARHQHTIAQVTDLQTTLDAKAPLESPKFTGVPTAPTAIAGTDTDQIATTAFVKAALNSAVGSTDSINIKGTVNSSTPLPATNYAKGDAYIVGEAGTYAGDTCEPGDWIIAIKSYAAGSATEDDWSHIQKNIASAVTFSGSPITGNLVKFKDDTGIVEDAGVAPSSLVTEVEVAAPTGDDAPKAVKAGNKVTISLPEYTLKSTYDAAIAGIEGPIKTYVDSKDITSGTLNHGVQDDGDETIAIADKAITVSLKNYALASEVPPVLELKGLTRLDTGASSENIVAAVGMSDFEEFINKIRQPKVVITDMNSAKDYKVCIHATGNFSGGNGEANLAFMVGDVLTIYELRYANSTWALSVAKHEKMSPTEVKDAINEALTAKYTEWTSGDSATIPTVAITEGEISGLFKSIDTTARVGSARVGTARVAASN